MAITSFQKHMIFMMMAITFFLGAFFGTVLTAIHNADPDVIKKQCDSVNNFDKGCDNPRFLGSEGLTYNVDLDRAFLQSKPLLNSGYRYYNEPDGNVLWRCMGDE